MRLMAAAQHARPAAPPFAVMPVEADPGQLRLQRGDPAFERRRNLRFGYDVELCPISLGLALPQFEPGTAAAVTRAVRVVAGLGLPVPAAFQRDMDAADFVVQPPVAEIVERVTFEPGHQKIGPDGFAGHLAEMRQAQPGRAVAPAVLTDI